MAWGKIDTAERARVGKAGEDALVELLREVVDASLDHVAAVSDGYGYDIAIGAHDRAWHIEVKSTLRRGRLKIYISRNEYEAMRRDPDWLLVALRLEPDAGIAAVATVDRTWLASQTPVDRGASGRWESCRIDVPASALHPGIASLKPVLRPGAPPFLTGGVRWPGASSPDPA
jgi:hypothetical protein